MEDLLESIVGNIQDEYDDEEEEVSQLSENVYLIDGLTQLEDVEKLFGIHFDDNGDYDTIGGYIIDELGYIPTADEHPAVTVGNVSFTVLDVVERRIDKIRVERTAPEKAKTADSENIE